MQHVTPMMVPLVLFRLSSMLAFLFSAQSKGETEQGEEPEKER